MLPRKLELQIGQAYRKMTHIKRFQAALADPRAMQTAKLLSIMRANEKTAYGRRFNFDRVHSIEDYQRLVPPTTYEELEPLIEQMMEGRRGQLTDEDPIMFANTSGTTGKPKYLPITETHLEDYAHAFQVHNWNIIDSHPESTMGSVLIFTSNDEEGEVPSGVPYGAVSGMLRRRQSPLVKKFFALPPAVAKIKDVEVKYYTMLRLALCQDVTIILGCNPSSFLLFADQMQEHEHNLIADIFDGGMSKSYCPPPHLFEQLRPLLKPNKQRALELQAILERDGHLTPRAVWQNLCHLSCWKGGPLAFYLHRMQQIYGNLPIRDFGYMASEGRGSIPTSDEGAGGTLAVTSHFFEFVPESDLDSADKTFLTADQIEVGGRYYIYFTTAAGLYRYNISDLIEVIGFNQSTPVIQFVQKGMGISSITGEKLTEEQVNVALEYAIRQLSLTSIEHFTFSVQQGFPPNYVCYLELRQEMPESVQHEFLRTFEQSLQLQNIEYQDKRGTRRLGAPTLQVVPKGTFTRLRQERVMAGAPEAQVKIPILNSSLSFPERMQSVVNSL